MDWQDYLKFFAALLFVLSLMGGLAFVLKKLGYGQGGTLTAGKKRLKIIEVLPLDARRKAIILERDNTTQHLVLLGPSGETVIETNIKPPKNDNAKD
jgi:flagellar protein FliO/FliZ